MANSKGETKRIAYERGCKDIFKVGRVGFQLLWAIVVALVVADGLLETVGPFQDAYSKGDFVLREAWISEMGGRVILDQWGMLFRPEAEAF